MFGWAPHPATLHKKQPCLIVTSPKHYPRKKKLILWYPPSGVPLLSVLVMVSMVTVVCSFKHTSSGRWTAFLREARQIIWGRLTLIPFRALNSNEGICVWQWWGMNVTSFCLACKHVDTLLISQITANCSIVCLFQRQAIPVAPEANLPSEQHWV